jgi:protoporphyrinogen/coproporphyrinogen III oxidase
MSDGEPVADTAQAAARAGDLHVVVVGGGMSGLVAALQCAKVGLRVTVLEASDRLGGVVRSADVAGLVLDVGAESYATRGGHVRALIDELGLGEAVVEPVQGRRAWVAGLPGDSAAPLPAGGILGIPANPFAPDVLPILGWRGAWRAYADRLRPVLTIGQEHSLGALVRKRLGERVVDRLVSPVTSGVYSAHPDDIDVDAAVPGLNAALTRTGSLLGAVAFIEGQRNEASAGKPPGAAVEGLDGGMTRLVDALRERLASLGVRFRTAAPVDRIVTREGGGWTVEVAEGATPDDAADVESEPESADAVIVAADEAAARSLLAPVVPRLADAPAVAGPVVDVVTLVLDAPTLDAFPRGTGVLTVPGSHTAKALTHSTAKWAWVARAGGARHVVRVSFGSQGEAPATSGLSDADAIALAVREAGALLGAPLGAGALVAGHRERFVQSQPGSAIGQAAAAAQARAAVTAVRGLGVVGAWIAGTGLAQVVPDALEEGDRVRRSTLWE